jgi:hypothetical protein
MHLAYSAISASTHHPHKTGSENENERIIRYRAYQTTCDKYAREIAAIQKYLPGWTPKFR